MPQFSSPSLFGFGETACAMSEPFRSPKPLGKKYEQDIPQFEVLNVMSGKGLKKTFLQTLN